MLESTGSERHAASEEQGSAHGPMSTIIRFEQVSKKFTLHRERPRSFQEQLIHIFQRKRTPRETFWALQDVSFTIDQGETVGLIGPNGAGKSTILKLIAQILEPTSGQIWVDGRVGALLELGAGFHPDLTGRENIFLNGSILGLSRPDSPASRWMTSSPSPTSISSSMCRSNTTHRACMSDWVSQSRCTRIPRSCWWTKFSRSATWHSSRSALTGFISCNGMELRSCWSLTAWMSCARCVIGRSGWKMPGWRPSATTDAVIGAYLAHVQQTSAQDAEHIQYIPTGQYGQRWGSQEAQITEVTFYNGSDTPKKSFLWGEQLRACIRYVAHERIPNPTFGVAIYNENGDNLVGPNSADSGCEIEAIEGQGEVNYVVALPFKPGTYEFTAAIYDRNSVHPFDHHHRMYTFRILAPPDLRPPEGLVQLPCRWEHHPA